MNAIVVDNDNVYMADVSIFDYIKNRIFLTVKLHFFDLEARDCYMA